MAPPTNPPADPPPTDTADPHGPWAVTDTGCLACYHVWTAVHPLGADALECPACHSTDTVPLDEGGPEDAPVARPRPLPH